jgi:hypothetical protein
VWRLLVWGSKFFGHWRDFFLTLSGPVILVMVLASWALLLSLATALVIQPNLGTGIVTNHGETPTDFITALYVGGSSLSFIGATDFSPQNGFFRLFYLLTSLLGLSLVSLIITYLMQLYENLKERNTLGLKVNIMSGETGDAAGIKTTRDGAEDYISLRKQWDRYVYMLAPKFAYDMNEIDTALAKVK